MSLQWTLIATFLYIEIAVCLLLMCPGISATTWKKVFNSRLLCAFKSYANFYFNIFIVILIIVFFDGLRDVRRFSNPTGETDLNNNPLAEDKIHMKLFRAQRNFYIAGFALFIFVVLRKLTVMLSQQATLTAQCGALERQATSASQAAQRLLDDNTTTTTTTANTSTSENSSSTTTLADNEELQNVVNELKKELMESRTDLQKSKKDLEAIKCQATSTNNEYDRLMGEYTKLQDDLKELECGAGESKKDN